MKEDVRCGKERRRKIARDRKEGWPWTVPSWVLLRYRNSFLGFFLFLFTVPCFYSSNHFSSCVEALDQKSKEKTSLQRLTGKEFKDLWIVTHVSSFYSRFSLDFQNSSSHDYKENEKKIIWKDQRWEIKRRWKRKSSVSYGHKSLRTLMMKNSFGCQQVLEGVTMESLGIFFILKQTPLEHTWLVI